MTVEHYSSAAGVEAAIRDTARKATAIDPSITAGDRITQEHFRRFLSRVFSEADDSGWILKGGTGILARVGSARTTRDMASRSAVSRPTPRAITSVSTFTIVRTSAAP